MPRLSLSLIHIFAKYDGLVRKIENDKYFVVFKYKYLDSMKEDKFKVLDEVKAIKAVSYTHLDVYKRQGVHWMT